VEALAMSNRPPLPITFVLLLWLSQACTVKPQLEELRQAQFARDPDRLTIEITDYSESPNMNFKHIFVSNFSVKAERGELFYSSSRDGLTDELKARTESAYGFAQAFPDWNGDGFSDLLMYLSGITLANQSTLYCGPTQRISSSNDAFSYADTRQPGSPVQFLGLRDCEKVFLQLDPSKFDHDADGIPDYLEVRAGLNPKNAGDANLSASADGVMNIDKVKRGIPIENANSQPNQVYSSLYDTEFDVSGSVRKLRIRNIPLLRSGEGNFIAIYLTETHRTTRQDQLVSAYIKFDRSAAGTTLRFPFWGNDPNASLTNQEIHEQ
jgi:hypothetical protein